MARVLVDEDWTGRLQRGEVGTMGISIRKGRTCHKKTEEKKRKTKEKKLKEKEKKKETYKDSASSRWSCQSGTSGAEPR